MRLVCTVVCYCWFCVNGWIPLLLRLAPIKTMRHILTLQSEAKQCGPVTQMALSGRVHLIEQNFVKVIFLKSQTSVNTGIRNEFLKHPRPCPTDAEQSSYHKKDDDEDDKQN